ncbi:alpha/beta-hydrolase [Microthyrium microscopicum]|uniref:Carboxylic ester hydrolase n=1 Tax=Microthyrium microscopicum TaxID=703497 RepID=A0A6A6TY57_9PEZI|nr:alpha/beta-hydrolase [Microthyrium microscopicum]
MAKSTISALLLLVISTCSAWEIGQEVSTSSGTYKGHDSALKPGVSEYLGIRYGQETSGARRFAKPVAFQSSEKFTANKFSLDCPTILTNITGPMSAIATAAQATNPAGEDCLALNVWTKPQVGEKKKAVMVWVYGGGFNVGTAQDKEFDGSVYAETEDVVVVTLNYRLVVFGFPSGVDGVDKNVGLRDQRLATEWVKANIEKFGGDPNRIILWGQSAGGFSVDNYAYAWAKEKDPVITGIIAQSGGASAGRNGMVKDANGTTKAWADMAQKLSCATVGQASVDCVRTKPWLDVLNAMRGGPGLSNGPMSPFTPTADNEVVFSDYAARAKSGAFIKVPLLIGNNDNESGGGALAFTGKGSDPDTLAKQNAGFSCPPGRAAADREAQGLGAWRYRFMAKYSNADTTKHGGELSVVWGTMDGQRPNLPKSTEEEYTLSKNVMKRWAAFAKDPKEGLTKLGWPVFDSTKATLALLGDDNKAEIKFIDAAKYDKACASYWTSMGAAPAKPVMMKRMMA